jgi:DNA-binding CsgD family transcriptional regulator
MLVGRDDDIAYLEQLVDALHAGVAGSLILLGEPGAGKTVLLQHAQARARDGQATVLVAQGREREAGVAYAGLHRLLHAVAGRIDTTLDPADATVLGGALRLPPAADLDPTAVAAATLRLLLGLAGEGALLLAIDDLHWLDAQSRAVLAFLIGRTEPAAIGLICTTRDEAATLELPDLPVRRLDGLDEPDVGELLAAVAPAPAPAGVRQALTVATRGNPRALVELAGLLTAEQLRGRTMLPDPVPLGTATEWAYATPVRQLPEPTRRVLLVAAADPELDPTALGRAAGLLDASLDALVAAEDAGLVTTGTGGVTFTHPLTRSAAYHAASSVERRDAHAAIATACPERAGLHRAAVAWEPSETLAAELAALADQVRAERGYAAAAQLMQRAAELTPPGPARAQRLHAAANDTWLGGDPVQAFALLDDAETAERSGPGRDEVLAAKVDLLRAQITLRTGNPLNGYETLLAVAARSEPHSIQLATRALAAAGMSAWAGGDLDRFGQAAQRAEKMVADRESELTPAVRLGLHYLMGLSAQFSGRVDEAVGPLNSVVDAALAVDDPGALVLAAGCAITVGDRALVNALAHRGLNAARATRATVVIPHAIEILTLNDCWSGWYPINRPLVFEGLRIARQTGQSNSEGHLLAMLALTAAVNGHTEECQEYAKAADRTARRNGTGLVAATATWAIAMLDVVHARWAPAYQRLGRLFRAAPGLGHPVVAMATAPYFVEAAVAVGRRSQAQRVLEVYHLWSSKSGRPGHLANAARCRALLAEGSDAEQHYREAMKLHQSADRDFQGAYTELLYARYLRRDRQRSDARDRLYSALEVFERLELDLWTKRVHAELRAVGDRSAADEPADEHERPAHASGLTAQQVQIATLVAEGATNREIAAKLFVSTRTVDYHLRNIFQRLGINSRAELIRRFG